MTIVKKNVYITITGTGVTFEMGPYKVGAEWTLTREELSRWNFHVKMMESLSVRPSLSIQMSYPSGLTENVKNYFRRYETNDFSQRNSSTGRENSV